MHLALYIYSVWLLPVALFQIKKLSSNFRSKQLWGQILKNYILYLYIVLISVCVFGGCSLWQRRVVIPVDIQRVHHFSTAGLAEMMNQVIYLWESQSGLSHVASSIPSILGWVTPLHSFSLSQQRASHPKLLFPYHPLSVKCHSIVYYNFLFFFILVNFNRICI